MKITRSLFKGTYYFILGPLYRRVRAEAAEESCTEIQNQIEKFLKETDSLKKEVERLKRINSEHQGRVFQQVSDEFVKMYALIEDIKSDRTDMKLNITLVNELVKIHQGLEALKYERDNRA